MVINCTAEMEPKSKNVDVVVAAAEKYLIIRDLTSEEFQGVLSGCVPSSQVVGMVQEQIGSK
jgi:predicted methyltransferase MtxX (methanogen marker protein 4)